MAPELTKVGTVRPRVGEWVFGKLRVGVYPDGRGAFIPLRVVRGKKPGPTVALLTGAHGDEINGPETVGRLLALLDPRTVRGTLIVLPLTNPWGFAARAREVTIDGRDLNRSFPGHAQGSFTFQVAHAILNDVVAHVDAVIDVHDAGTRNVQLPHTRVHLRPASDPTRALGLAFGSDVVIERQAEPGMLAGVVRDRFGIPAVTVEVGGATQLWESFLARGVHGLRNMLRALDVLSGSLELPTTQRLVRIRHGFPAELSGIQTSFVRLGEFVAPGQPLYRIYNPNDGRTMIHRARACGIVLGKNLMGHVARGDDAIDVLAFMACGRGAPMEGDVVHNRAGDGVVTFPSSVSWAHHAHRVVP
ncbi:MAG: succinylglutamate desuccinylase/aspartoacylase family protein [Candidatus Andersenbacteria bacterium]